MPAVGAVYEGSLSVIPPRSCKIYFDVADTFVAGESAAVKYKARFLFLSVSGCSRITAAPYIVKGSDLAVLKQSVSAAEDKVDSSGNITVFIYLYGA